jgi:hypothetical protein
MLTHTNPGTRCAVTMLTLIRLGLFIGMMVAVENAHAQANEPAKAYPHDNSIALDTTGSIKDTAKPVTPYSPVQDSLLKAEKSSDSLSAGKKQDLSAKSVPGIDSVPRVLSHPYFGVGAGWGLGSFPVLSDWQNALPDSAANILPVNPDTLGFTITEPVNTYNILFPLYLSYTPFVYSGSSVAFEGSFFFIGKSIQATLQHDTLPGKINYTQSMNCYGFSLGVFYRRQLDEQYFKIENVDKTSFILGLSALPYVRIAKNESLTSSGIDDSVISAAKAGLRSFHAWGMGGAWRIGIGSQQTLSATSGLEISISYIGRYMGIFRQDGTYLLNKDVNPSTDKPSDKLSFLSNTVEIRLDLLFGKKRN